MNSPSGNKRVVLVWQEQSVAKTGGGCSCSFWALNKHPDGRPVSSTEGPRRVRAALPRVTNGGLTIDTYATY
jgi:hypothetical protein